MTISRVSDAQTFAFLIDRAGRLQMDIQKLQEQIASGRRLLGPEQDPLAAAQVVRSGGVIAALGQYAESSRFGLEVMEAEDDALGEAEQILVRAREIAAQQASGLLSGGERAAAREEVHGLLQGLTALGNTELAGRRVFGGLALDAPPPFADPDTPGYTAATAYTGSAQEFEVKIGSGSSQRLRVTTRGDAVFGGALQALEALETALAPGGDVTATMAALEQAGDALGRERASVGVRQSELLVRIEQADAITFTEQAALARARDADVVAVVSRLVQVQTALQATLAAGSQVAQTSLVNLLQL